MKVELKIPSSQHEMTVGQYQKWAKLDFTESSQQFQREKIIQIFCNVPLELVNKMKRQDFLQISNHLFAVLLEEQEFVQTFKMGKTEYGFIPKLDEITNGEYIDLDVYFEDVENFHLAMAVLYRKVGVRLGDNYRIYSYKGASEYGDLMKDMPLSIANGAKVFFYRLSSQLLTIIPKYLQNELMKEMKGSQSLQLATLLEKNGVGISTYTQLLQETISKLKEQLGQSCSPRFNTSAFKKITTTA